MFLYLELYVLFVFSTLFFANSLFCPSYLDFVAHQLQHKSRRRDYVLPPWFICRPSSVLFMNFETPTTTRIRFGAMPTEKSANVNLQKEGMLKVKCVGVFCCDITMSYFCHHSHQSACSEKAEWWLRPSPTWFWVWKLKKKKKVSQMTALLLLHFLYLWGQVRILILFFPSCGLMLNYKKRKKKLFV